MAEFDGCSKLAAVWEHVPFAWVCLADIAQLDLQNKMVAPAEAGATKMTKLYLFATTFGAGLLASS